MAEIDNWSTSASLNTTVGGINIAEGMDRALTNDAIRAVMAGVKEYVVSAGSIAEIKDDADFSMWVGTTAGNLTNSTIASTGFGYGVMPALTSGQLNTGFGTRALNKVTSGGVNSAFGTDALATVTTGEYNDAYGCKALANLTVGKRNKAFGQSCFMRVTSGGDNCGMGQEAGINITTGSNNVVIGSSALYTGASSSNCTVVGTNSCYNSTAALITAFGKGSFFYNTTGEDGLAVGFEAGYNNTTANANTLVGTFALYNGKTGGYNTCLGHRAGYGAGGNEGSVVDTYCTFVGQYASRDSSIATDTVLTNSTALGNDAKITASNQIALGNAAITSLKVTNTATAAATVGAQTINKPAGSVNFAANATSLVVTSSAVTANSIIIATVNTNDSTMKSVAAVAAAGSFTLHANAAATAETRVSFLVIN